jgi:Mor family transcriptional regulator
MKTQTKLSDAAIQSIRQENKTLLDKGFYKKHARRYKMLAQKWNCSEWTVRWLCQGRTHKNVGGYIEDTTLHNRCVNRSVTQQAAIDIQNLHRTGSPIAALATSYNVSEQTIKRIVTGQTYRDVSKPVPQSAAPVVQVTKNRYAPTFQSPSHFPSVVNAVKSVMNSLKYKLNNVDAFLIRMNHKLGQSTIDLAMQYSVSENEIRDIISGTTHSNAGGPLGS